MTPPSEARGRTWTLVKARPPAESDWFVWAPAADPPSAELFEVVEVCPASEVSNGARCEPVICVECLMKMPPCPHGKDMPASEQDEARCGTCGSDDPSVHKLSNAFDSPADYPADKCCPDPFHNPAPDDEEPLRGSGTTGRWRDLFRGRLFK